MWYARELCFRSMAESSSQQPGACPVDKEWNVESNYNLAIIKTKTNDMKKQLKLYSEIAKRLNEDDWKYPTVQELLKL